MKSDIEKVIDNVLKTAKESGGTIYSEHLLLALIDTENTFASMILKENYKVDSEKMLDVFDFSKQSSDIFISGNADNILQYAKVVASNLGVKFSTEHLLYALVCDKKGRACQILQKIYDIDTERLRMALFSSFVEKINDKGGIAVKESEQEMFLKFANFETESHDFHNNSQFVEDDCKTNGIASLQKYGFDMTEKAKNGKFDPIIGRDKEIARIIQALCRRSKNNPVLVGEPGVGKSAVVEGLAQAIVKGDVPEMLKDKIVFSLDMTSMLAGAKYRGEFEERFKIVLDTVSQNSNIILFIDEIHTIVGAGGGSEGAMDAGNILKPMLARGQMQLIGATTIDEYRKYIEKDSALERRFQPVNVEEPSVEDSICILQGVKEKYEKHHGVKIDDSAIVSAVELSQKYITDRFLPDKAFDLIDEASARKRIETNGEDSVNAEDVAEIVADLTGIPTASMTKDETQKLANLEKTLHSRVIGQNEAVSAVARAIRRARTGLSDPSRPIGSFIFLGPTGVGKTELSKALATAMFDDENKIIRFDMSEYMQKENVSRLIGSAPGFVGYEEGGQLTEKVRRNPYSVVLFDEIEKAHPDIFNIMLQILDDGRLTDSHGRVVNFKNTVIIMTSNAGATEVKTASQIGFGIDDENDEYARQKQAQMSALRRFMKPEFLNRVDEIITFKKLSEKDSARIGNLMLRSLQKRLKKQGFNIDVSNEAEMFIVKKGYSKEFGARPMKRIIQQLIEDSLSDRILSNQFKIDDSILVDLEDGKIVFKKM